MRRRIKLAAAVVGLVGLGATAGFASNTFTDVPAGRFYSDAVDWAFNNGVTVGTSATTFSPEDPATRAQSVTLLHRYDQNVVQPALDDISSAITTNTGDIAGLATAITSNAGGIAGLDTLGELSCTAAQVVINDNGWRCADPVLTRSFAGVMNYDVDNGGEYTSVAIGTDGNPVISHYDGSDGGGLVIYVCGNEACTTGTSRTLDGEYWAGYFTSIAIGANGNPIISYRRNDGFTDEGQPAFTQGSLRLYVCDDPACTTGTKRTLVAASEEVFDPGNQGFATSIAIGDNGNPVISHGGPFSGLHLYVCDDPTCTTGTNRTLATASLGYDPESDYFVAGLHTSVAIGADGNPVISHQIGNLYGMGDFVGGLALYVCDDPACTTGTKRTLGVADPAIPEGWEGYFTSIAIGDDGNPVISHGGPFSGLHLYVCDDPTCTTGTNRTLATSSLNSCGGSPIDVGEEPDYCTAGQFTSVAIGADGNPVISHQVSDLAGNGVTGLALYVCDDPACTTGTNLELAVVEDLVVGWYTSVAIGADGNPVISHGMFPDEETVDGPEILALYVCDDPACTTGTNRTLVTQGEPGGYTSIAIGVDGNPIISHYCDDCGTLDLYVCDDPACTTGTNRTLVTADYLENGVRVGGHTSIAIGVDGNPVISHTAELTDGPNLNVAIAVFAVTGIAFE